MIRIETITNRAAFDRLRGEWDDVFTASGSNEVKAAHGCLSAWARTRGKGRRLFVLRVRDRRETIAFVPLMFDPAGKRTFLSDRTLSFMGESWYFGRDVLVARDRETVVPTVLHYLSRRVRCSRLHLSGILDSSPNLELYRAYTAERGASCTLGAESRVFRVMIRGRSWDEYLRTTSKSFIRNTIARLKNRYAEREWSVRACGVEQLPALLPTLTRLHHSSQMRQGRGSKYYDPVYRLLLGEVARHPSLQRCMRVYLLEIDGQVAAYELDYLVGQMLHCSNTGFDPRFEKLSPSKYLKYHILEAGFRDGWGAYCLGAGEEDYKRYWGAELLQYYGFTMSNGWGIRTALRRWGNRLRVGAAALVPQRIRAAGGAEHAPFPETRDRELEDERALSAPVVGADRTGVKGETRAPDTDFGGVG